VQIEPPDLHARRCYAATSTRCNSGTLDFPKQSASMRFVPASRTAIRPYMQRQQSPLLGRSIIYRRFRKADACVATDRPIQKPGAASDRSKEIKADSHLPPNTHWRGRTGPV